MITPLTTTQQEQFDALLVKMEALVGDTYTLERDTFMNEPLRYSQTAFFPINKALPRARMRADLETVISSCGFRQEFRQEGKGVYLTDNYTVGDFIIYVACARRGGRIIGFKLAA